MRQATDGTPSAGNPSLSLVCVYNDIGVRRHCLDRSLGEYSGTVDVEYIPVDNREHRYVSAGAALNAGARRAHNEVVVLVHQDVYLHSLDRLAEAARALLESPSDGGPRWGLLGASGVTHADRAVGRIRDRVRLNGDAAVVPIEVDSVDEVLFMIRRDTLLEYPLTEDPDLAWHAYAVELGLRLRRNGYRVGATDSALTHNSMSTNMRGLAAAHQKVRSMYPEFEDVRTTCGILGSRSRRWRRLPLVSDHGWRLRWLRESRRARALRRLVDRRVVLSELIEEVDHLAFSPTQPLHLFNLDRAGDFAGHTPTPTTLERGGRPVIMSTCGSVDDLCRRLASLDAGSNIVIEDLDDDGLLQLRSAFSVEHPWIVGVQPSDTWVVAGPNAVELPDHWRRRQARPLGFTPI